MNLKKFLGMLALDINANEIGKIRDVEFDQETGQITKIIVASKKNIMSSDDVALDFSDVKSIGDYVLVNTTAEKVKATIVEEAEAEVEDEEETDKVELD